MKIQLDETRKGRIYTGVILVFFSIIFLFEAPPAVVSLTVGIGGAVFGIFLLKKRDYTYAIVSIVTAGISTYIFLKAVGMLSLSPLYVDPIEVLRVGGITAVFALYIEWIIPIGIVFIMVGIAWIWALFTQQEAIWNIGRIMGYIMLSFIAIMMIIEIFNQINSYETWIVLGGFQIPFEVYYFAQFTTWLFSGFSFVMQVASYIVGRGSEEEV